MATNASPEDIILYNHCWQGQSQIDTLYRRTLLCYCLHQQELWGAPQLSLSILIWSIIDHVEFGTML